jgi:transcriptional regulator with XRE-family HTH domain
MQMSNNQNKKDDEEPIKLDLAAYVRVKLKQKNMTTQDVENRSEKRITRGYVSQIMSRTAKNLTVDKMVALADGLGEPVLNIVIAALGGDPLGDDQFTRSLLYQLHQRRIEATPENRYLIDLIVHMLLDYLDKPPDGPSRLTWLTKPEQQQLP